MSKFEIEIKFTLPETQLTQFKQWLEDNAKFKGRLHQVDYYLDNPEKPFTFTSKAGFKDAAEYFRVRVSDKGDSTCLKVFHRDEKDEENFTHCTEHETDVEDGNELLELYKALGYQESCVIDKTRKKYTFDEFEVVIDEVKGLDEFIEIELKEEVEDYSAGYKKIKEFLKKIGITEYFEQKRGYVSMLWNPDHDFSVHKKL